jgi:hypothetical protein
MLALQKLAQAYDSQPVEAPESPSEKVLRLALELPASRPALEREAMRLENLLDQMEEPVTDFGAELLGQLADIFDNQIEAIYGLLEAEGQDDFDWSCAILLQTHSQLSQLEDRLESAQESQPLFA